jgi:hypothetical protein
MHIPRLAKTVLASGVALAATTAMLGAPSPASATAVSPCIYPTSLPGQPGTDVILLKGTVDFGTGGLNSSNDAVCGGTLTWDTSNNTIRPILKGDLIQKNHFGVTARVLVSYYDVHNTKVGSSWTDGAHLADSDLETDHVTIDAYANPLIYRADVKTQVQQADLSWSDVATTSAYLGSSTKASDPATINATGYEFGGSGGTSGGAPINAGSIWWDTSGNQLRASVLGTLYFTNKPGATARLRLKTFDVHGNLLQDWPMPPKTVTATNGTQNFPINYGSSANSLIYKAQLSLEVLVDKTNNTYQQVGNTVTAYI